ncbi:unnamed protein product [Blepharisma stoltei]|uniref:Uncharacterized protein n=1 Tax=Blepharisma stoltei TaxID=1481888 RepID=A0AAU9IUP2_9CILI|nr:unnamed protein product [Blepharisma stoltei]
MLTQSALTSFQANSKSAFSNDGQLTDRTRELRREIKEVLDFEYDHHVLEVKRHRSFFSNKEQTTLKRQLDKLISSNKEKRRTLRKLVMETRNYDPFASDFSTCKLFNEGSFTERASIVSSIIAPSREDIIEKIERYNQKIEEAEQEKLKIECVLTKEKEGNLIWKERIQQLSEMHRRVTKSHEISLISKQRAINNLILGQNETILYKQEMSRRQEEYVQVYTEQRKRYDEIQEEIDNIVTNISGNAIKQAERRREITTMIDKLEKQLRRHEKEIREKERLENAYQSYQEQLSIINEVLERYDRDTFDCLDEESLTGIIDMYKFLIYQETSLSSRFQELTLDFLALQKRYEVLDGELQVLKTNNDEFGGQETNLPNTFNMMKFSLEDNLSSKNDYTEESEMLILKLYLIIMNLAILSINSMRTINERCPRLGLDKEPEYMEAASTIEELQKGFLKKRESSITKSPVIPKLYKTEFFDQYQENFSIENFKKNVMPYISLKKTEIISCFKKAFKDNEDSKLFANLIKEQPMILYFTNSKILDNYLNNKNKEPAQGSLHAFLDIIELISTGHMLYQHQFMRLSSVISPLILSLNSKRVYELEELEMLLSKIQEINHEPRAEEPSQVRRVTRIPTIIKERTVNKFIPVEENEVDSPVVYKIVEPSRSQEKLNVRLTDEEAAIKRMKSILPKPIMEKVNKSYGSDENERVLEGTINVKDIRKNLSQFSPRNILYEVKDIERKIKRVKTAEKKAGNRNKANLIDVPLQFRFYSKPWGLIQKALNSRDISKDNTRPSTQHKTARTSN